jgi:lipid-binding SYLF domain-containing protein
MSQTVSDKVENETISTENESLAVNDVSFNVIHQPNRIPSKTESFTSNIKEKFDQTTAVLSNSIDFSMPALLKQARYVFSNFVDPKLPIEQRIPFDQLGDIKGVMFLSVVKGGFGVGGLMGSGIIMARNPSWKSEWSAPAAIAIGGLQIGVHAGIEKTDHLIFIRDEEVITKFRSGLRLGGDIGLCVGTLGRNANVGMTLSQKGVVTNLAYSMSKGIYLGFALEGAVVTVRNDCNEAYFAQKTDISEILKGTIIAPFNEDYNMLCKELEDNLKGVVVRNEDLLKDEHYEHHPILNISSEPKKE